MAGSEDKMSPLRYQEMVKGSSPSFTKQISCAIPPSFMEPDPKEKGMILGGSVKPPIKIKGLSLQIGFVSCDPKLL